MQPEGGNNKVNIQRLMLDRAPASRFTTAGDPGKELSGYSSKKAVGYPSKKAVGYPSKKLVDYPR